MHLTCIEQDLTWICATQHTRLCACLLVYDTHICARAHTHTQAYFAEAAMNPAVYMRIPGAGDAAPQMSAADAPFVDAAAEEVFILVCAS